MTKTIAVFKKDFKSLFFSPLAYIVIAAFLFLNSYFAINWMREASMRDVFGLTITLLVFMMPVITMRAFADEFRNGTDELLMTSPLEPYQIVFGKFLAIMGMLSVIILLTLQYVVIIGVYGSPDWGPVFTGYAGLFLVTAALASVGVFVSSLTRNHMIAGVLTFAAMLFLIAIQQLSNVLTVYSADRVLQSLDVLNHFSDFEKGVLDSTHFVFYAAFISVFLFLTVRRIEARRY